MILSRNSNRLLLSVSVLAFAVGLSGCASLQNAWAGMNASISSGQVTLPKDMPKGAYIIEGPEDGKTIALTTVSASQTEMPTLTPDVYSTPQPIDIELFDRGPSYSGFEAVSYANRTAVVKPRTENYLNAVQLYPYTSGSLYQIYTSPAQITDIALEKGEGLITVSAGDTQRWTVGDTVSGAGSNEQVHVLIRPMAANLSTNAIITSTRRTYYLDLKSFKDTYMAAVSWRYPQDFLRKIRKAAPQKPVLSKASLKVAELNPKREDMRFNYVVKGDSPNWRPIRVFDDGAKVYIQFPQDLAVSEAPPLFITDQNGKQTRLVNYRVKGEYYVVDRLFDAAELRLGEKKQVVVRIERLS